MFVFLQVISAQQLPKINQDKAKSIVDPLVKVEIYGVPADNASKETKYITNNGQWTDAQTDVSYKKHIKWRTNNPSLQASTPCGTRGSSLLSTL